MPISEAKLAANRANAKKSTGPKTARGKYFSSRNAITHGLHSQSMLLPGESEANFQHLLAAYRQQFNPTNPTEHDLVETVAVSRWRVRRIWCLETASLSHELRAQSSTTQGEDPPARMALAFQSLSKPPRSLESLSRFEACLHRQCRDATERLQSILNARERAKCRENKKTSNGTQQSSQNEQLNLEAIPDRTVNEASTNRQQTLNEPPAKPGRADLHIQSEQPEAFQ